MAAEKISPGMQQYLDIKKDYPDAFLLFRMGDFYELFYEDAVNAAQILEISLTSRNKNAENPIPMAGVPYHSAQQYIDVLIEKGYKVAIAEQMEEASRRCSQTGSGPSHYSGDRCRFDQARQRQQLPDSLVS